MRRSIVAFALALALAATSARADQLLYLDRPAARHALDALAPGARFVAWVAQNGPGCDGGSPALYEIREVRPVERDDHAEIHVLARLLATATPAPRGDGAFGEPWRFSPAQGDAEPVHLALDLAYVYVASAEVADMYVCLGKKLGLACDVAAIAIEVRLGGCAGRR